MNTRAQNLREKRNESANISTLPINDSPTFAHFLAHLLQEFLMSPLHNTKLLLLLLRLHN